jgi:hypothetical protein
LFNTYCSTILTSLYDDYSVCTSGT